MSEVPVRLLRETLQARGPAAPSQECLDAETVAAWADDTLSRDERRAAEAHAADCVWCQALVAAMARTAPPPAAGSWWRMPAMGWLVPLTAAAAALLVWMILPGTPPAPSSTFASRAIVQEAPRPAESALSNTQTDARIQPSPRQDAPKGNSQRATTAARDNAPSAETGRERIEAPAAAAKALAEVARGAATAAESVTIPAAPLPAAPLPAPASAPFPQPQQAAADLAAATPPPVTVRRTAAAPLGSTSAAFLAAGRGSGTRILSPIPASQWRILSNGAVQHSTDGGSTWDVQSTGVSVMLTAGVSPAPSICWLVGPQGIVLLSTDGRSWRRVAFPEMTNLASVSATDDKSATVTTSDGRTFRTTDGGGTWTR